MRRIRTDRRRSRGRRAKRGETRRNAIGKRRKGRNRRRTAVKTEPRMIGRVILTEAAIVRGHGLRNRAVAVGRRIMTRTTIAGTVASDVMAHRITIKYVCAIRGRIDRVWLMFCLIRERCGGR